MPKQNQQDDENFPVLKEIVKPGDESIIKTSRLGHEVIREIEELELKADELSPAEISRNIAEKHIDNLVDEIIERHTEAMRAELKQALSELTFKTRKS